MVNGKMEKYLMFCQSFQGRDMEKQLFHGNKILTFHGKEKLIWVTEKSYSHWLGLGVIFFPKVPAFRQSGVEFLFIKSITGILHNFPRKLDTQPNIYHFGMCHFPMVNQTCKIHFFRHHMQALALQKNISVRNSSCKLNRVLNKQLTYF